MPLSADKAKVIDDNLNGMSEPIIQEADTAGIDIALGCAIVEQESGGQNIFGCDAGDVGDNPPYCHQPVTQDRVFRLRDGGNYSHGMNGVGITQLTWWELVEKAEALGGAHLPVNQCRIAFGLMRQYLDTMEYADALAAYNAGPNNLDNGRDYAKSVARKHLEWRVRLQDKSGGVEVVDGPSEPKGNGKVVTADDIVASARELLGVWYKWWEDGDPIPMWYYDYPTGVPPRSWFDANGTMCSDLINFARMDNGLDAIGGTPAYYDWVLANGGSTFDPNVDGVVAAICVNPGVWRGGTGQGHVALYTDDRTLIQATDGQGSFAGVNEGEQDYDSYQWAGYWAYGLMNDVDYSKYLGDNAPTPTVAVPMPRWQAIDKDGWYRADGPDWSKGWHPYMSDGTLGPYKRSDEA